MPWEKKNPDLTNDSAYLEPRISELEKRPVFSGDYSDLENRPTLVTSVNGESGDITIQGFSGDYNDLINKPIIPSQANQISVSDSESSFVSTDVEGVLQELFTSVSNGKHLIATAIADKGIDSSSSDSFQKMANNIASLFVVTPDDPSGSPGDYTLVAGSINAGYFGTVPSSQFITGNSLASMIGLSAGTILNSSTDWLKFAYNGKILFSPMKPIRYNLSWNDINSANAVNGSKTVSIGGLTYKIRLWRGAENTPANYVDSDKDAIGSEWNKLMLPIHEKAPSSWLYNGFAGTTEDWGINFSDSNLGVNKNYTVGSYTWCQERRSDNTTNRILRGNLGVEYSSALDAQSVSTDFGWRPVLEVIQ